jgi:hypothetical protein
MPLVVKQKGAYDCPVFICFDCGEEITGKGNMVWAYEDGAMTPEFVHKPEDSPECDSNTDIYPYSCDINDALDYLTVNFSGNFAGVENDS